MAADGGHRVITERKGDTITSSQPGFMLQPCVLRGEGPPLCILNLFSNLASVTEGPILIQVEVKMAVSSVV